MFRGMKEKQTNKAFNLCLRKIKKKNKEQMAAIRFCTLKNLMPNVCINIMSKNKNLK